MIHKAFRMSVYADRQAEYARRHNPVWAELEDVFAAHGVRSYAIFLDATTNDLFAYVEVESEERWSAISRTEVCQRWWEHMKDVMPSNPDSSPRARDLREVFRFEPPDPQRGKMLPRQAAE